MKKITTITTIRGPCGFSCTRPWPFIAESNLLGSCVFVDFGSLEDTSSWWQLHFDEDQLLTQPSGALGAAVLSLKHSLQRGICWDLPLCCKLWLSQLESHHLKGCVYTQLQAMVELVYGTTLQTHVRFSFDYTWHPTSLVVVFCSGFDLNDRPFHCWCNLRCGDEQFHRF